MKDGLLQLVPPLTLGLALKIAVPCAAVVVAWAFRRYAYEYSERFFVACVSAVRKFADRRWVAVAAVSVLPIVFRLSLLPWLPIPVPAVHDEYAHLLVADTLASGRLSNTTHPFWIHFESPYILHQPTYASIYPPGQGAVLALSQRLTGQPWFGILVVSGLMCGAICWALQEVIGRTWAFVAGLVAVIKLTLLRVGGELVSYWVDGYWGGALAAIGGALLFGALIRSYNELRWHRSLLMAFGWTIVFLIRPFEAAILAVILAVVLATGLLRSSSISWARKVAHVVLPITLVLIVAGSVTAYYNYAITGDPWLLPYQLYKVLYGMPQGFLWQQPVPDPGFRHESLADLYNWQLQEFFGGWSWKNITRTLRSCWEFFLGPLFTIPILALPWAKLNRQSRLIIVPAAAGLLAHGLYWTYMPHYSAAYTVAFILSIVVGLRTIALWRWRGASIGAYVVVALITAALASNIGTIVRLLRDYPIELTERAYVEAQLKQKGQRHLVFVRYRPGHNFHHEWVYNSANIDMAPVVWAREWTAESDRELMGYFADRFVWSVDADAPGGQPVPNLVREPKSISRTE
jgi:hypothetical protein